MADDPLAPKTEPYANWTKLFTAFRVALDLKKLLLAAGGIVATAIGWWLLGLIFYGASKMPEWKDYAPPETNKTAETVKEAWDAFKVDRRRWNLLHEMAGPPDALLRVDAADVANTYEEFLLLDAWAKDYRARTKTL